MQSDIKKCDEVASEESEKHDSMSEKYDQPDVKEASSTDFKPKREYIRLCGYLNKYCNRGILKTFRKRWFVFSENNCKLYYYRTPKDQESLGEIDISKATFTFDVSNKERPGLFTISIPGRDYFLEANNRQTCLFWLQELQKFRRSNSMLRTGELLQHSEPVLSKRPQSGLLANTSATSILKDEIRDEPLLMAPVDCPKDAVGDTSLMVNNNAFSVAQQKLSNLRNQVMRPQNSSYSKSSSQENELLSSKEKRHSDISMQSSFFFDKSPVPDCKDSAFTPPTRSRGLSSFSSKIAESLRKAYSNEDVEQGISGGKFKGSCPNCSKAEEKAVSLMDEVTSLQDELTASKVLIKDLKLQLEIFMKERETLMSMKKMRKASDTLDIMNLKDQQIVNLTHDVLNQKKLIEKLQQDMLSVKTEIVELQQQNNLLTESLMQKDKTIVSLTNEVFDLETAKRDQAAEEKQSRDTLPDIPKPSESMYDECEVENLKLAVKAFELQNKFLNNEILELNQLRNDSERREDVLAMKCSEWEARCCQIQSKLLLLLSELQKPGPDFFEKSHDLINRLLQEAMADSTTADSQNLPFWSIEKLYDEHGFNWKWGKDNILSSKAENLQQRSTNITNKAKEDAEITSWQMKWDNFIVTLGNNELQRSPELKTLLRQGVPREYKGRIWKGCVEMCTKSLKLRLGSNYYNKLLSAQEFISGLDPSSKQIELDLLRTLPNNRHYENLDSDGIPKLRRVLLAYSRHDPVVGYCQGLNRLAAIALLFMDEEDSFWCLVAIVKYLMPEGYYTKTLIASQVDQRVMKDLMVDKLPRLHTHLEQYNVDLSLFTFNWFLTVFIDNIPPETYLRIWDVFLYEGSKVLFRYSLAFFKYCENDILQLNEYIAINRFLRNMAEHMTDMKRLSQIAFGELNPFPQRVITSKREQHMVVVKAQLDEMESIRNSLPRNSEKLNNYCPSEED